MTVQSGLFDFAAEVGITKHFGGLAATNALIETCHIGGNQRVLDVGCGVGVTPVLIAESRHCNTFAVDISPRMTLRAQERTRRARMGSMVTFSVADARALPFEDGQFDAVITESVTVFLQDKQQAVREYARVTKPGGYVGLAESTWLNTPVPPELIAWASQDAGATVLPLTSSGWVHVLESAGLTGVVASTSMIDTRAEAAATAARYGRLEMLQILGRMLSLYARSKAYRQFVREVRGGGIVPATLKEYLGYGIYVGQKPNPG